MSDMLTSKQVFLSLRVALVGPLPPPSGGMANQTLQLEKLLRNEGVRVDMVQVNRPYHPLVARLKGVRALFRLIPYLCRLWRICGKVNLVHVMANSGWSWHFFAAPAIWIAHLRGTPVVVNYHGGEARSFLKRAFFWVKPSLDRVNSIIVPSGFLATVFREYSFSPKIVPNVIDFNQFFATPAAASSLCRSDTPRLLVARNLELIYDNSTALRAFKIVRDAVPGAHLTIAGSGPELAALQALGQTLHLGDSVTFTGRIENQNMPQLYRSADIMLNPSLVDNMPISILEALACGIPVISTDVGGVPYLVRHEKTALLVPARDPVAMANAILSLLHNPQQALNLREAGIDLVTQYTWASVRQRLFDVYSEAILNTTGCGQTRAGE